MNYNNKIDKWVTNNTDKNWGKWSYTSKGSKEAKPWPEPPTDEEMIRDILPRVEDEGFFGDLVAWLRMDAPRKLRWTLQELHPPMHTGPISYERLCEVLYQIGFRASEVLERRMMLGPSNQWVRKYLEDFPNRR